MRLNKNTKKDFSGNFYVEIIHLNHSRKRASPISLTNGTKYSRIDQVKFVEDSL